MQLEFFNDFDVLAAEYDHLVNQVVRKVAFDLEKGAKARAPVLTGFLRSSIYVRTEDSSDMALSGSGPSFPEVEAPGHNNALVAVGAEYGIYVEFGTHRASARPYLVPAAEAVRQPFQQALEKVAEQLHGRH